MNYSHLIHERSLTTTPHRQKPIIRTTGLSGGFPYTKKQVGQSSTCLLCGGSAGICSKRSLRNSKRANLFAKRSVSPKYGVHVAEQRHDEIVQNPRIKSIKKQVEQGSTCFLSGGSAGI